VLLKCKYEQYQNKLRKKQVIIIEKYTLHSRCILNLKKYCKFLLHDFIILLVKGLVEKNNKGVNDD